MTTSPGTHVPKNGAPASVPRHAALGGNGASRWAIRVSTALACDVGVGGRARGGVGVGVGMGGGVGVGVVLCVVLCVFECVPVCAHVKSCLFMSKWVRKMVGDGERGIVRMKRTFTQEAVFLLIDLPRHRVPKAHLSDTFHFQGTCLTGSAALAASCGTGAPLYSILWSVRKNSLIFCFVVV